MRTLSAVALLIVSGCRFSLPQEVEEEAAWELVWEDDFDQNPDDGPDSANWTYDLGNGPEGLEGWGNNEIQYYQEENAQLNGSGFLVITAKRDTSVEGFEWTSARLKSQELQNFQYGRIEIRARTPVERGIWPALWMLGNDIDEVGWPFCGEIDIMEVFGQRAIGVALHGPGYDGQNAFSEEYDPPEDQDFAEDFHVFQLIWDPEHIVWTIDGNQVATASTGDVFPFPWVFDHPFFFILNVAVGGNTVNPPNATTPINNELLVDWIRVYQRPTPLPDPRAEETE